MVVDWFRPLVVSTMALFSAVAVTYLVTLVSGSLGFLFMVGTLLAIAVFNWRLYTATPSWRER